MKKILPLLLFFLLAGMFLVWSAMQPRAHFVHLDGNQFRLNGKNFYPLVLNYEVSLQANGKELWAAPYLGYRDSAGHPFKSKDSCLAQLRNDMRRVHEMGFNTVRLVGIGEEKVNKPTGALSLRPVVRFHEDSLVELKSDEDYRKYFKALSELFGIINQSGLKAILLTRVMPGVASTEDHLVRLAERFKEDSTIMAYDLFNEPLYFDTLDREKKEVFHLTKDWNRKFKKHAPDQLLTIGLVGIREVFEWDPNAMNVDFLSFHPYEFEPGQVKNEMYWFSQYVEKTWIIGETGLPADNDSVPYVEQKKFAEETMQYGYDCGDAGYSWWQYKDVNWKLFHASFLGVINRHGEPKPVVEAFQAFRVPPQRKTPEQLPNYFNYSKCTKYRITGKLVDQQNKPLVGGVIMGWDITWLKTVVTVSKADGTFELYSDWPMYHFIASSTLHAVTKGDLKPEEGKESSTETHTIDVGNLQLWEIYF